MNLLCPKCSYPIESRKREKDYAVSCRACEVQIQGPSLAAIQKALEEDKDWVREGLEMLERSKAR